MGADPSRRLECYAGNPVTEAVSWELAEDSYRHGFKHSFQSLVTGLGLGLELSAWPPGAQDSSTRADRKRREGANYMFLKRNCFLSCPFNVCANDTATVSAFALTIALLLM